MYKEYTGKVNYIILCACIHSPYWHRILRCLHLGRVLQKLRAPYKKTEQAFVKLIIL